MIKFFKINISASIFRSVIFFVAILAFLSVNNASAVVLSPPTSSGLVGYWTFDNQHTNWISNTTLDLSGQNHTGTMVSMTEAGSSRTGKLGQAMLFDGNSTYISVSSNPITTVSNPSSACMWAYTVNVATFPGGWDQTFLNFRIDANNGIGMGSIVNSGSFFVSYRYGGNYYGAQTSSGVFSNNRWSHVCYVWDGNGMTLYANGNSVATSSNTNSIGIGSVIGARDDVGDGNWSGAIDDMRIYNRALTLAEIRRIYLQNGNATLQSVQKSKAGSLNSGLAGYWTMDGNDVVNGVALDRSGSGNNGNLINIATSTFYAQGKIGQGFKFDGLNDYVNTGSGPSLSGNKTISFWIYPTVNSFGMIIKKGSFCSLNGLEIRRNSLGSGFYYPYTNGVSSAEPLLAGITSLNKWTYVTFVHDETNSLVSLYINGVFSSSLVPLGGTIASSGTFSIGQEDSGCGNPGFFQGSLDDVRIYNRAITQAEITQLYNIGGATKLNVSPVNASKSGLVGYWTFDGNDVVNGVALDRSGNGNNGNLINISTSTFYAQGKLGQGFKFDGVDDYVIVNNETPFQFTTSFTVSLWINIPRSLDQNFHGLLGKYNADSTGYNLGIQSGHMRMIINGTSGIDQGNGVVGPNLNDDKWHLLTLINTPTGITAYVDGIFQALTTGTWTSTTNSNSIFIGNRNNSNGNGIIGSLDDVRIYNRAITQAEITQLYNTGR